MLNRAYSLLAIKQVEEDSRVVTGMASTPTPDRMADVVEPEGAQFKLPIPLLFQHDSSQPIGHVTHARVTKAGIEISAKIARVADPGRLKDRLDEAWQSIKAGLISGLSIGFRPLEHELIPATKGLRFKKWEFLELSAVTIPANSEANITTIKNIDTAQRAALGRKTVSLDITPAGASACVKPRSPEGNMQRTIAEQIGAFETSRIGKAARLEEIQSAAIAEDRSKNEAERDEFDTLSRDIDTIDEELKDLRRMEAIKAAAATPVRGVVTQPGSIPVHSSIIVKAPPKLEPGIEFIQRLKVHLNAKNNPRYREDQIAESMYGADSAVAHYFKAAVPAGTTISPNWASNLVALEAGGAGGFLEYLRPATILGKFGTGNVPSLNTVGWRQPLISQSSGGAAWWVGEGAAKPVTSFNFARDKLLPTKLASICVLTMENIRDSSPSSDTIVRDQLRAVISQEQDKAFIDPTNAGTANIKPASITNGASTIASTGTDYAAVTLDVRSLMAKFTANNNPPSSGVWIMNSTSASALGTMMNPLGQQSFPTMNDFTGGTFFMMPVIVSDFVGSIVVLVNAKDIFLAQDDGIQVDMSDQAAIEMSDAPTGSSATPTGTSLVSLWQTNSVGFRAEHAIGWKRGRSSAVAYLTGVHWGGDVHTA
jgi:HK97 family phage major capsid protein/HK97 family phage prohead protease